MRVLGDGLAERLGRDTAQIGHVGGGDRHPRGLVALPAMGMGRQERAVGLHHQAVGGHEAGDLRQRARVLVGHRPRERDHQAQVEAALGHVHVGREAVHDAADLVDALRRENRERLRVRVAAVDDDRLAEPARHVELPAQRRLLRGPGREVAEEVEPHLPQRHHPGRPAGQPLHRLVVRLGRLARVVGMNAHGGPDRGHALGQRHRGGVGLAIGADGHHPGHPGGPRALQHRVEVRQQLGEMQMRVRVEERHQARSGSAFTFMIRGPSMSSTVQRWPAAWSVAPDRGTTPSRCRMKPATVW